MKILAWDTSTRAGALVAMECLDPVRAPSEIKLISEWNLNVDLQHSERLLWSIDQVLQAARWKMSEVDVLGVGVGPGSFTGLRVGVTTARSLGYALKKPVIGVSSLVASARSASPYLRENRERSLIVVMRDAAKGELFALVGAAKAIGDCIVAADGDRPGVWKRGVEEGVYSPDDLAKLIKKKSIEGKSGKEKCRVLWIGEDPTRYPKALAALDSLPKVEVPELYLSQTSGRALGTLVWQAFQAGLASEALSVKPHYLRASDAEAKLSRGLLKPAARS
jgi:tRNA threonylcarbamoyladenosine biosynthesis protein TsaB